MNFRFRTVLAYAADDGSARHVTDAALRAVGEGGRVILYPLDSASRFSEPTPTEWSAEGAQEEHQSRSEPEALELLGQADLAQELRRARESGADVQVRLAREPGLEKMVEVAREEGADAVLLPAGHEDPGIVDRVLGEKPKDDVADEAPIPVLYVAPDGSLSE